MNWGWKITIFLAIFIVSILSAVFYSFTISSDLVAEDYYNQEIQYQVNIDAQKNALPFASEVSLTPTPDKLIIAFPATFDLKIEKGDISFYRPDNAKLDKSFALKLNADNQQSFAKSEIASGFYKVTIQFISEGKTYLINKDIWL